MNLYKEDELLKEWFKDKEENKITYFIMDVFQDEQSVGEIDITKKNKEYYYYFYGFKKENNEYYISKFIFGYDLFKKYVVLNRFEQKEKA